MTGATGFVGSRLLSRLGMEKLPVRALYRQQRLQTPESSPVDWLSLDLAAPDVIYSKLVNDCTTVIHLAGQAHDPGANDAAYELMNHAVTRGLAQAAASAGVEQFVFVSTIKVNGGDYESTEHAYSETDRVFPQGHYGESKWRAEQALQEVCDTTGMRCTILRPPLVYGPGVRANFLALMKLIRSGVPIPLGSVENARSMIYVDNLCDLIVRAMQRPLADNKTYVAADITDSTPGLIRQLARFMGTPARLMPVPVSWLRFAGRLIGKREMIASLTESLVVDDSHVRSELEWQPPVESDIALQRTVGWFLRNYR